MVSLLDRPRYHHAGNTQRYVVVAFIMCAALLSTTFILYMTLGSSPLPQNDQPTFMKRGEMDEKTSTRLLQGPAGIFSTNQLIAKFDIARAQFREKLNVDYGKEVVDSIFFGTDDDTSRSMVRSVFKGKEASWEGIKNKMARKILAVQITETPQPFVWATGGHSASAGHGNFFNESYTATMGVASGPIFEAVGLDFLARNYAMGATACGMEIASCMKEVFGHDVDILSWDYGMTTGRAQEKVELFFHRGALLPSRPGIVNMGNSAGAIDRMESLGPPIFRMVTNAVLQAIPDTAGKTQEEIDAMPKYVRAFRCEKQIEKGDLCLGTKYTYAGGDEPCDKRKFRVSWHPGWKWHAFHGNFMTMFLIEIINDALIMIKEKGSDPQVLLQNLKTEEDVAYQPILSKNISDIRFPGSLKGISDIPNDIIYWNHNYCHTARLPAEIRFMGLLTETKPTRENDLDYDHYDRGQEIKDIRNSENAKMELGWDQRLYANSCSTHKLRIDYPDFFMVNGEAWSTLTLPNEAESEYYNRVANSLPSSKPESMGFIALCLAQCERVCPKDLVTMNRDLTNVTAPPRVAMKVNGEKVQKFTPFSDCAFLKHAGGHQWTSNNEGRYEISAKTMDPSVHMRVTSITIW